MLNENYLDQNFEISRFLDSQEFLEKFHFSISRHFTFHSRNEFKLIFISLFTSQNEWTRFSFHFSLELPISTLAGQDEEDEEGNEDEEGEEDEEDEEDEWDEGDEEDENNIFLVIKAILS